VCPLPLWADFGALGYRKQQRRDRKIACHTVTSRHQPLPLKGPTGLDQMGSCARHHRGLVLTLSGWPCRAETYCAPIVLPVAYLEHPYPCRGNTASTTHTHTHTQASETGRSAQRLFLRSRRQSRQQGSGSNNDARTPVGAFLRHSPHCTDRKNNGERTRRACG